MYREIPFCSVVFGTTRPQLGSPLISVYSLHVGATSRVHTSDSSFVRVAVILVRFVVLSKSFLTRRVR